MVLPEKILLEIPICRMDKKAPGWLAHRTNCGDQYKSTINTHRTSENDLWIRLLLTVFVDPNGHLRVSGQSGINLFYTNELVFPSSLAKVGNEYKFRLLDARFTPQYASGNKVYVVGIYFKAQVRFRKRLKNQSVQEDIEQNTRTIEYKTSVFLGNADVN